MARYALTNPFVSIGGQDLSDHVAQVMIHVEDTGVTETITAGNAWAENTLSGKGRWSVTLDFVTDSYQAAAPNGLDGMMRELLPPAAGGTATGAAAVSQEIVIRPDAAAESAANPQRSGQIVMHAWDPLGGGQVGQIVRQTQTYVGSGALSYSP